MDIKHYGKENIDEFISRADNGNLKQEENENLQNLKEQYGDKIEELINKFQGMDETQLIGEVIKLINKQKQDGTFDPQKIYEIAQSIKPLLNQQQQEKLNDLLSLIAMN